LSADAIAESTATRWRGWAIAAAVYLLAVLHRTSLGIAGLQAQHRFHIGPGELSVFVFLQLGVYAAMQVPTGVLVDRFGPRRLLVAASLIMGTAQLLFAMIPSYPAALFARALLGCGDALTFVSVLRFAAAHFAPRRYPLLVAITAMSGTVGNVLATLPLAVVLRDEGWQTTFTIAAVASLVLAGAVTVLVPATVRTPGLPAGPWRPRAERDVRASWALPGTRMGFWVHFSSMSAATAFGVLWGGVYLVNGAGFSTAGAGAVLMAGVVTAALASPALGSLIARYPVVRVPISLSISLVTIVGWLISIAALGDHPARPYVVALFLVMMLGGPASTAAFAIARDYNPAGTLGTASGVVNVGGFVATIVIALGIGIALTLQGTTTAHTLRLAALVAVVVQAFGTSRVALWLLRVRAQALAAQDRGETWPVRTVRRRWDLASVPAPDEATAAASEA
jgi:MFS family permease